MRRILGGLAGLMLVGSVMGGCGVEAPVMTAPPPITRKQEVKLSSPEAAFATGEGIAAPYNPAGRRDPFKPLISAHKPVEGPAIRRLECPPLQEFDLASLKLVGIVWGEIGRKAMVKAPTGQGYTLSENMLVGRHCARVRRIESSAVILEQIRQDAEGKVLKEEVVLHLREREG
jgi:Tfp pilus assembly protein PilP